MKVSELSTKVDDLINAAMTIKSTADSATSQPVPVQEDDPEIAALAGRIDDAIAVLQGASGTRNAGFDPVVGNTPGSADPNAPVI